MTRSFDGAPIERRPMQPVVFPRLQNLTIIRVQKPRRIRHRQPYSEWLLKARPLPWDLENAEKLIAGELDPWHVEIRPRAPHGFRLLYRAVQAATTGRYHRALKLAQAAERVGAETLDLQVIDLAKGFLHDLLGQPGPSKVRQLWLAQADWWAGGRWEHSGKLGEELEAIARRGMGKIGFPPKLFYGMADCS